MARLAIQLGGALLGSLIPGLGTALGFALGGAIGGVVGDLLFPGQVNSDGPRLNERQLQSSANGNPIPFGYGTQRVSAEIIQGTGLTPIQAQDAGGQWVQTYYTSVAAAFGEGPATITRLWFDSKLVYDIEGTNYRGLWSSTPQPPYGPNDVVFDQESNQYFLCIAAIPLQFNTPPHDNSQYWVLIEGNYNTANGTVIYKYGYIITDQGSDPSTGTPGKAFPGGPAPTLYTGSEDQTVDPFLQSLNSQTPAYRGLCYAVFENLVLLDFGGRLPNIRANITYSPQGAFPQLGYNVSGSPQRVAADLFRRAGFVLDSSLASVSRLDLSSATVQEAGSFDPRTDSQQAWTIPATTVQNGALAIDSDGYLWAACQPGGSSNKLLVKYDPFSFRAVANIVYPYDNFPDGLSTKILQDGKCYVAAVSVKSAGGFDVVLVRTSDVVQVGHAVLGSGAVTYGESHQYAVFDDSDNLYMVLQQNATSNWWVGKIDIAGGVNGSGDYVSTTLIPFSAGGEGVGIAAVFNPANDSLIIPTSQGGFDVFNCSTSAIQVVFNSPPMWDTADFGAAFSAVLAVTGRLVDNYFRIPLDQQTIRAWDVTTWGPTATYDLNAWIGPLNTGQGMTFFAVGDGCWVFDPVNSTFLLVAPGLVPGNVVSLLLGRIVGGPHSIAVIIGDICQRCGLDPTMIDATELGGAQASGYMITKPMTGRQALVPLMQAYAFDCAESDFKLKFLVRPRDPVMEIPEDDLGLVADKGALESTIGQESDMPLSVEVMYQDRILNYQQGKQAKSRSTRIVNTRNKNIMELALGLDPTNARQIAERWLYLQWLERFPKNFNLWKASYLQLDPCDVVVVDYGIFQFRQRIVTANDGQDFSRKFATVSDDPNNYQSNITGGAPGSSNGGSGVTFIPPTLLFLLDIPLLSDLDNPASGLEGFYWAAGAVSAGWPGCALLESSDNSDFTQIDSTHNEVLFGYAQNTLAAPRSPWTWDNVNSLTVRLAKGTVPGTPTPQSASPLNVLNGANMVIVGKEIIQFQTATLNPDGTWTLSGLLRGRRGTEWACSTHLNGDLVLFVNTGGGIEHEIVPASEIGQLLYYRAVSQGQTIAGAPTQSLTLAGNDLKPYAPAQLAGSRDGSNNLTITWVRRTRIGSGWLVLDPVPLNEATEAYSVDILDNLGVVKRTISASTPTANYSAAQQTTDGFTPGNPINVAIYQVSSAVGRGFAAKATV